jgi:DNA-dependent metalloprotease WSS1
LGEEFEGERVLEGWGGENVPSELCGGTYRSRGKKRARKELSYQERKQRRIERKFGKNGVELGGDLEERVKLENGKMAKGKPRVAGSARGRELRAAAALARFDKQVKREQQEEDVKKEEELTDSEGSDYEEDVKEEAVDIDGTKLRDRKGNAMVRVCEGEDVDDIYVKREMDELQEIQEQSSRIESEEVSESTTPVPPLESGQTWDPTASNPPSSTGNTLERFNTSNATSNSKWISRFKNRVPPNAPAGTKIWRDGQTRRDTLPTNLQTPKTPPTDSTTTLITPSTQSPTILTTKDTSCPLCTTINAPTTATCAACAHILDLDLVPNHWRCKSEVCKGTGYVNAGYCGRCGVCGGRREED